MTGKIFDCFWPSVQSESSVLQQMSLSHYQNCGSACEVKRGIILRHPQQRSSSDQKGWYYMQLSTEPGVRCWVILCVAVIRWELDAPLNCLGGCLQGMTSYDAAWGAESAWTGCWPKHPPSKTSCTATHTAPICIMSDWSIHSGSHTFCSLGSSVICRISTKHVNRKYFNEDWEPDWMEALVQFLRPVIFNSAGILFAF